jgi:predicted TIM-barrel fold metal-dependent hydrolase
MRKIDAFAHILPPRYLKRLEQHLDSVPANESIRGYRAFFYEDAVLADLDARWRKLDGFGDYAQVLVLAVPPLEEIGPPDVAAEFARLANDEMAELVREHPDRFLGFCAALPLSDTDAALAELDRATSELSALGGQLFTNMNGIPLDDARFAPLFTRFEELEKMIWLHPTRSAVWPDYPTEKESKYGLHWSLGWPYETGVALSRLVFSGIMERHPRLRLIAHHCGGMVPHFSARLATPIEEAEDALEHTLTRPPLDYFRRFYTDTAMFGAAHAVRCAIEFFGPEQVLFGTDMPLGGPNAVEVTVDDLESIDLSDEDLANVYSGNAARLLGVR